MSRHPLRWTLGAFALIAIACSGSDDAEVPVSGGGGPDPATTGGGTVPSSGPIGPVGEAVDRTWGSRMQAMVATSGAGVGVLMDGDPTTSWKPAGDAMDEGVLLRFEEPLELTALELAACGSEGRFNVYRDGSFAGGFKARPGETNTYEVTSGGAAPTRSLFIQLQGADCFTELSLKNGEQTLDVGPPRSVKGTVSASSTLTPDDAYHSDYLFDARTDFGWVEGQEDLGVGASVTLDLAEPVELHGLELWNGYQRSGDHWAKNARAKKLGISVDGGAAVEVAVKDTEGSQKLDLPAPMKGKKVKIEILEATPGSKYKDLVLSELRLVDGKGPLTVEVTDASDRGAELKREIASSPLAQVVDQGFQGACDSASERSLKLRSDHSFVYYRTLAEEDGNEVFDGTWVMSGTGSPWAEIKFYGRRHRTSVNWNPYGQDSVEDVVKIAGGKAKVARVADLSPGDFQQIVGDGLAWDVVDCAEAQDKDALAAKGAVIIQGSAMNELVVPR